MILRRFILGIVFLVAVAAHGARVDFNREIRPLLADACFRCHGFDAGARKAGLRLDLRAEALKPAKSGALPIVPGKPESSEVMRRLLATAADDVMPPESEHRVLTPAQKESIRRWIAEGAEYAGHWAYLAPTRPPLPEVPAEVGPVTNPIDAFVRARLAGRGLQPSREADKATLIRRVTLDLTGLPPTLAEVDDFLADRSPNAWARVVDRLLASPRYGERMANDWLDAARFADSNGYQVDRDREMWAWRDWVVGAFNRNLPFDRFTLEQFAGDLLPDGTLEQRIATGFHRNHMINEEGGIIAEEFLNEYCADRVETTATVWLGLTFNCARCHDHKYDPFTQRDFYGLYAFFHNITEQGVGNYGAHYRRSSPPYLRIPAPELEEKFRQASIRADTDNALLTNLTARVLVGGGLWEQRARNARPSWATPDVLQWDPGTNGASMAIQGDWVEVTPRDTNAVLMTLTVRFPSPVATAWQLDLARGSGEATAGTNRLGVREVRLFRVDAPAAETNSLPLRSRLLARTAPVDDLARALDRKTNTAWIATFTTNALVSGVFDTLQPSVADSQVLVRLELEVATLDAARPWLFRWRGTGTALDELLTPEVDSALRKPVADRKDEDRKRLDEFRLAQSPEHVAQKQKANETRQQATDADNALPVTLVLAEMDKPRETFVLKRGAYDKPGEAVGATTPASLPPLPADAPRNRLGLARWLVDPSNPLTARVTVNRIWQSFFGTGIVRTAEDFGVQGEWPSHPELLDWLATEFVGSGWDVKAMVRLIVTSATYLQDSRTTPALRAVDPENRLLARGPRHRLSAEIIRDQALASSGLLVGQLGGPSVKPYHPPGLYEQVVAGSSAETYVMDHGPSLYRRTLYTYWKRSVPNPALLLFDRPFRESCAVRRSRTTTPLQALNLLNDPTYVEAARALAQRMMTEGGDTPESRIGHGFRCVTAREPRASELRVLMAGWRRAETGFRTDAAGAAEWLKSGESRADPRCPPTELAAYAVVASTLLNLDEAVTKE